MKYSEIEEIFFQNLERRLGIDIRGLLNDKDKNEIEILKNHLDTLKKINSNRTRGGEKGRKGFDFEYLDANDRKNRYLKEGKNRKVYVLDNNDQITDIIDGRKKKQLKNVSNINSIDFDKYIENGATIVVPKDKYSDFVKELNNKIKNASTKEEKEKYRRWKNNLEPSELSTSDIDNPNFYLLKEGTKDLVYATKEQYIQRIKSLILSYMIRVLIKKIKEIYNNDEKNYIEAIKEIFIEIKSFIEEVWKRELIKSFMDVIVNIIKEKIFSLFKSAKEIVKIFLNNIEEFIVLVKKLIKGDITLKEFLKLGLKTLFFTIITTVGFVIEETIAKYIPIPIIGEFISIIISIGIVTIATVLYETYIEEALFGVVKLFESEKVLLERKKTKEIKSLVEKKLPNILENREELKFEFANRLNSIKKRADSSFNKLKDDSLTIEEFENEFKKLGNILGI